MARISYSAVENESKIRKEWVMGKVTNKLLTPVVAALCVGLLAQQASAATEEMVVYGSMSSLSLRVGRPVFRAEIENYIRTMNAELRATLDQDLKRAPKLELAGNETRSRG